MLIYSPFQNNRFRYAVSVVLRNYTGEIKFTSDIHYFRQYGGPRIQYGAIAMAANDEIFIDATSWIWQESIEQKSPQVREWNGLFALDFSGHTTFDIFASSFYIITRYEEYSSFIADKHGRFSFKNAWAANTGYIKRPVIDLWRKQFEEVLKDRFPQISFRENEFNMVASIDVDSAYAFKNKGLYRTIGGIAKDISALKISKLMRRMSVLFGNKPDPFDTYREIQETCARYNVPLIWFFLLADFAGEDINVPHSSNAWVKRIQEIAGKDQVGIHPGYASNEEASRVKMEIERLATITGKHVENSRQHFLKLRFPSTYNRLLENSIAHDYTMGYADHVGFRAGTSFPFNWFNLETNQETTLIIHPFACMDSTLVDYMSLSQEKAIEVIQQMVSDVKSVNGTFISLWHNETLSDQGKWKGWKEVWEKTLVMANH